VVCDLRIVASVDLIEFIVIPPFRR
jgi:hypothetical protein